MTIKLNSRRRHNGVIALLVAGGLAVLALAASPSAQAQAPYYYNYCSTGINSPHYSNGATGQQMVAKFRATCPVDATIWQVTLAIFRCSGPDPSTCTTLLYNSNQLYRNIAVSANKQKTLYAPPVGTPLNPGAGFFRAEAVYCPQPDMNVYPPCKVKFSKETEIVFSDGIYTYSPSTTDQDAPEDTTYQDANANDMALTQ